MTQIPNTFPPEIWMYIVDMLIMPEIREISRTCKHFSALCAKRLQEQQRIAQEHFGFVINDKYGVSGDDLLLHELLFSILRGDFSATYIFELYLNQELNYHLEWETEELYRFREKAIRMKPFFEDAVRKAPWIEEQEKSSCVEAICTGDEAAVLCVLVPLLTNLRAFKVPVDAFLLERTLRRIARASASTTVEISSLPLRKLVLVISVVKDGRREAPDLHNLVTYAAIPSVRRLVAVGYVGYAWDGEGTYGSWEADLPLSNATEVYFEHCCVVPAVVLPFASRFAGPCVMRQLWNAHESVSISRKDGDEWNYLEISGGGTGREIKMPENKDPGDVGIIMLQGPYWHEVFETNLEDWRPLVSPQGQ